MFSADCSIASSTVISTPSFSKGVSSILSCSSTIASCSNVLNCFVASCASNDDIPLFIKRFVTADAPALTPPTVIIKPASSNNCSESGVIPSKTSAIV